MTLFTITDYALWTISLSSSTVFGGALAFRFWTTVLKKEWPIFSAYIACSAFRSATLLVLFLLHQKHAYYRLYWWTELVLQSITLLSILDVASQVGRYGRYLQNQTRTLVGYAMCASLVVGCILSSLSTNSLADTLARFATASLRAVTLAWCLTVLLLILGAAIAGFTWRRAPWLLTSGFIISQSGMAIWAWCASAFGITALPDVTRVQIGFNLIHFVPWIALGFSQEAAPITASSHSYADLREHLGSIDKAGVDLIGDQ